MKNFYLSIAMASIVFLLGCNTFSSSSTSKEIDIHVGVDSIRAEFIKTAPPQTVFEKSNFPVVIKARNIGAYNIKGGLIAIGLERDYVPRISLQEGQPSRMENGVVVFDLPGKSQINMKGDEMVASLNAETGALDPQSETKQSTITATFCYPYKTIASATICIDPDIANVRPVKKVCQAKEITLSNGQGAPIAVTKIETQMVPEGDKIKPQFLIYLENKGLGTPVSTESYDEICKEAKVPDPDRKIWNTALLKVYGSESSTQNEIDCTPGISDDGNEGLLKFRDRKDFVKCIFTQGKNLNDDAYTTPIRIEIDYGYIQSISTNFIIQKPLKY